MKGDSASRAHAERREAATALENFLDGTGEKWDLDDFLSRRFDDEVVREVQAQIIRLAEKTRFGLFDETGLKDALQLLRKSFEDPARARD